MNGEWGSWGAWMGCTDSCDGTDMRDRYCDSPAPSCGGDDCVGFPDGAWQTIQCGSGSGKHEIF